MIRSERLSKVIDLLNVNGSITVDQMVAELDISPATARRDLDVLSEQGLLRRTRGGAMSNVVSYDLPLRTKRGHQLQAKMAIAEHCLSIIQPGGVIGMTGGSTVGALATRLLEWANQQSSHYVGASSPLLTVVTNAIDVAHTLSSNQAIKVVVIGGVLNNHSLELTGPFSYTVLERLALDYAFIGVNGFDDNGPGTVDEYEAETNRLMATRASRTVVVADSTKFGRRSFSSLGGPDIIDTVITDSEVDASAVTHLEQLGYQVVVTQPSGVGHIGSRPAGFHQPNATGTGAGSLPGEHSGQSSAASHAPSLDAGLDPLDK